MGTSIRPKAIFYIDIIKCFNCVFVFIGFRAKLYTHTGRSYRQHRDRQNKMLIRNSFFLSFCHLSQTLHLKQLLTFSHLICVSVYLSCCRFSHCGSGLQKVCFSHLTRLLLFVSRVYALLPTETIIVNMCIVVFFSITLHTKPTPTPSLRHNNVCACP